MTKGLKTFLIGAMALASAAALAPAAWAGCGGVDVVKQPAAWQTTPAAQANPLLQKADFAAPPIVGLWSVNFFAGGHLIDFGYQVWHSDGTEILNSGGRAPATENFCMGVWTQTALNKYALNHFALSYDATTGKLNAKVNITETVSVNQTGDFFAGPFTLTVHDPKTGAVLQTVSGTIQGKRLTVF